jgi:hypothetical protein
MAQVQEIMAQSQLEGASLALIYDDTSGDGSAANPFIGTAFIASVGANASKAMQVHIVDTAGHVYDFTISPNRFNQVTNIPTAQRPHGIIKTSRFGLQTIDWGLSAIGISF